MLYCVLLFIVVGAYILVSLRDPGYIRINHFKLETEESHHPHGEDPKANNDSFLQDNSIEAEHQTRKTKSYSQAPLAGNSK